MLNIKFTKKLAWCYICCIALYGSENWTLTRKLERKYLKSFEMKDDGGKWRIYKVLSRLSSQTENLN